MKSVLVCVLCGQERQGWINPWLWGATIQWANDKRFRLIFEPALGFGTPEAARNWATERAILLKTDFLLMADNDLKPSQGANLVNLLDLAAFDLDIVGAPVPIRKDNTLYLNMYQHLDGPVFASTTEDDLKAAMGNGGLLERDALGGAALCVKREVLEAMRQTQWLPPDLEGKVVWPTEGPPWPVWLFVRDALGNYVQGEDLLFCRRAKHLGFRVFASLHHLCGHDRTTDHRDAPRMESIMGLQVEEVQVEQAAALASV